MITFEKEHGALAASADLDEGATRELPVSYRCAAGSLAERASAIQTRETYRDLASYVIPNQPITDADARSISILALPSQIGKI